ncbi:MAG: AAA family ATPase [Candidatus Acidiferrales bacterium]
MPDDTNRRVPLTRESTSPASLDSASSPSSTASSGQRNELRLLIDSRSPIITVETTEEERLAHILLAVATELCVPFFTWSVTGGLTRLTGSPIYGTAQPEQALANIAEIQGDAIFLLKDFGRYCDNDRVSRLLRDLSDKFRAARRSIVISGPSIQLPPELQCDAARFQLGLPSAGELLPVVNQVLAEIGRDRTGKVLASLLTDAAAISSQLAQNLVGLPEEEAARTLRKCLLARGATVTGLISAVLDAKHAAIADDGLLEPVARTTSFADVAGLKNLRAWIEKRSSAFTAEGQKFGLVPPKVILIAGVQGCGKSVVARAIAGEWGVELARLDAGSLYDKYVGESEKRLHRVLELAQKLAPMVLWIDELEKAFASAGSSGDADAGLSHRLVATLLTWMQDREGGVFLAATSNNISALPPEMLRKGRFDEIFFVDLPDASARAALFSLHLQKRGRDASAFDLPRLSAATDGFSGAEIEQSIIAGLYTAFGRKQPLSTEVLLAEIAGTQPLSVTRAEDLLALRTWAKSRAVPAA